MQVLGIFFDVGSAGRFIADNKNITLQESGHSAKWISMATLI
jgi:hypothetical protein